jgi:2-polyprenyl-6-methoxyphenol hydroxylase-like FAD-dependent oxidoreductase
MQAVIIGAGPTGLETAIALARRGHQVAVIDRDGAGRTADSGVTRPGKESGHEPGM